jgi:hypothetical protein
MLENPVVLATGPAGGLGYKSRQCRIKAMQKRHPIVAMAGDAAVDTIDSMNINVIAKDKPRLRYSPGTISEAYTNAADATPIV